MVRSPGAAPQEAGEIVLGMLPSLKGTTIMVDGTRSPTA